MVDIITVSSKGQIVIPKDIRDSMGIEKQDKFILVHDKDSILLKRIKEGDFKNKVKKLLDQTAKEFKKQGMTKNKIQKEIDAVRRKSA
jgi:AbrB family looped-hinge helix DNA binding protein